MKLKFIAVLAVGPSLLSRCAILTRSVQSASDYDLAYCSEEGFTTPQQVLEARRRTGKANIVEVASGWQDGRRQEFFNGSDDDCTGLVYNINTKVTINPITGMYYWGN